MYIVYTSILVSDLLFQRFDVIIFIFIRQVAPMLTFLTSAAMRKRGLCCRPVSVRPS